MKSSKLIVAMMLLSFAFACFISAPALHAEDPWDVDSANDGHGSGFGGSGGGDPADTTSIMVDPDDPFGSAGSDDGDWLGRFLWDVSLNVALQLISFTEELGNTGGIDAGVTGGDLAAR